MSKQLKTIQGGANGGALVLMTIQSEHTLAIPANDSNKESLALETVCLANLISDQAPFVGGL